MDRVVRWTGVDGSCFDCVFGMAMAMAMAMAKL
jgi:hypothetical protein